MCLADCDRASRLDPSPAYSPPPAGDLRVTSGLDTDVARLPPRHVKPSLRHSTASKRLL